MKVKYFSIPNILTLANLLCGCLAVLTAASNIWSADPLALKVPFLFIIASALFDFFDGFSARLLGQYSKIGVQLDSLADMVSFGLAPSVILTALYVRGGGEGAWYLLTLSVALFSALRLAKFNIDDSQTESFEGLPTPACAIFAGSLGWMFTDLGGLTVSPWLIPALSVVLAIMLIAPVRMLSLKFHGFSLRDRTNIVRYGLLTIGATILIVGGLGAAWWIIIFYILTSIIHNILTEKREQ